MRAHRMGALLVVLAAAAVACSAGAGDGPAAVTASPTTGEEGVHGEIVVQAAASLTDVFDEIGDAFETVHPDATLVVNVAGSATLVQQLRDGAPADVFASADVEQLEEVRAHLAPGGGPVFFAANDLAIVVEAGNPHGVASPDDLADPDLLVVLAHPQSAAAGAAAQHLLARVDVDVEPVSWERDVRAVLAKVALGEADAGIVFSTDLLAGGDSVEGVEIPATANVTSQYPIAVLDQAPNPEGAAAFVDFVRSAPAQQILRDHGFLAPSSPP